jgi:predicted Zn-dependent peptidase
MIYEPDISNPLVTYGAIFKGSVLFETPADNGIFNVIRELFNLSGQEDERIRLLRGSAERVEFFANKDSLGFVVRTMKGFLYSSLELFASAIRHFEPSHRLVEITKSHVLTLINRQSKTVEHRLERVYRESFYNNHPYRLRKCGSVESVANLARDEICRKYHDFINTDNMALFFSGDIEIDRLNDCLERLLGSLSGSRVYHEETVSRKSTPGVSYLQHTSDKLAFLVIAYPASRIIDSDRLSLDLLRTILSGRLGAQLRQERDLAYFCNVSLDIGMLPGSMFISLACRPANVEQALDLTLHEIECLRVKPVGISELNQAKATAINRMYLRLDPSCLSALLFEIAYHELFGFESTDYFQQAIAKLGAATAEDISRAAARYFNQENSLTLISSPLARAKHSAPPEKAFVDGLRIIRPGNNP